MFGRTYLQGAFIGGAVALLVACLPKEGLSQGSRLFATAQDLPQILAQAQGGDVINLAPGYYPALSIHDMRFAASVVLDGQGLVIFEKLFLAKTQNITLRNISIEAGETSQQDRHYALTIVGSQNISLEGSRIGWSADGNLYNDGMAVLVRESFNVSIERNIIHNAFIGLTVRDSDQVRVRDNVFRDIRRDGINVSGSVDVGIVANTCRDFHPVRPVDHPDCIQFWNDTAQRSNENIRIINNKILRGAGGVSQGIFLSGQKLDLPHKNVLIEGNIIRQGMGHGIFVHKAENVMVRANKILPAPPLEFVPALSVRAPVAGVLVQGNLLSRLDVAPALVRSGAVVLSDNQLMRPSEEAALDQ